MEERQFNLSRRDALKFGVGVGAAGAATLVGVDSYLGYKKNSNEGLNLDLYWYYPEIYSHDPDGEAEMQIEQELRIKTRNSETLIYNFSRYDVDGKRCRDYIEFLERLGERRSTHSIRGHEFTVTPKIQSEHLVLLIPEDAPRPYWMPYLIGTEYGSNPNKPTKSLVREAGDGLINMAPHYSSRLIKTNNSFATEMCNAFVNIEKGVEYNHSLHEIFINSVGGLYVVKNTHGGRFLEYDQAKKLIDESELRIISEYKGFEEVPIFIDRDLYDLIPSTGLSLKFRM